MTNSAPTKVVLATRLMWLFWAAGAAYLSSRVLLAVNLALPGVAPLTVMYAVVLSLLAGLVFSVSRGRNWARITYSVIVAIASLVIVVSLVSSSAQVPVTQKIVSSLLVAGYGAVIWLLFHPDSSTWFKKGRASAT